MTRAWFLAVLLGCSSAAPETPLLPPGVVGGTVSAREGLLPWVFVYVKTGLEGRQFPVPKEPVLLDQHANEFIPHVFGIRAGQPLRIQSSDAGLHNVFSTPFNNREFNETLFEDQSTIKVFEKPEVMIQFKCNIHANMVAYAGVVDHPFFAVTGADGAFEIRGLPPGEYTLEAWNEFHGSRTLRVMVGTKSTAPLRFIF